MAVNPNEGHRKRLKKKYVDGGFDLFSDHEILELLLFYAYPRQDTNKIAHNLINEYGSLSSLIDASVSDICKKCNVTENVAILITLVPPMFKRYNSIKFENYQKLSNSAVVSEYVKYLYTDKKNECFYLICLDKKKDLITTKLLSEGSIDETPIYIRNIMQIVVQCNATCVILSHNHPAGEVYPSPADIHSTKLIIDALEYINVKVLDHIIVGNNDTYSLRANGVLKF